VESEDRLLRTDPENIYAFKHKGWNHDVVENEDPARLEFVNRNPRLFVVLDNQDTDSVSTTATAESGKLVVSEVCISPWIVKVSYTRCTCSYLRMSLFSSPKILRYAYCLEKKTTTVIPRLTKIIRSGITFVSRNVISLGFYSKSFNSFWMLPTI